MGRDLPPALQKIMFLRDQMIYTPENDSPE
jgi:hypothetical protein